VPSESRSRVALRRLIPEQQAELQGFRQADVLELRGGREGLRDVLVVEGSTEAHKGFPSPLRPS
jgi:hypothetical protein